MNKKIENNKHYKKGQLKKINSLKIINAAEFHGDGERYNRKPFTAWPRNKLTTTNEDHGIEVIAGRTKNGGYVSYPKRRTNEK